MTDNPQYDRVTCYFCLSEERQILEEHHIVPRRFDGSDDDENLVRVCPTCHQKLERLYDDRFYDELEVERSDSGDSTGAVIHTRIKGEDGSEVLSVLDVIEDIEDTHRGGAPAGAVLDRCSFRFDEPADKIRFEIEKLKQKGEVYEPEPDTLMTT
jgi:DNA replicative helicase MCM subunit Mcm2 (Cdc46/Mcm family)